MSLDTLLFLVLQLAVIGNGVVSLILIRAAWKRPHIWALTVMAISSTLVTLGLATYVWAVANAAVGFPVSQEATRVILRTVLIGLSLFPYLFLWVYITGRFTDGEK